MTKNNSNSKNNSKNNGKYGGGISEIFKNNFSENAVLNSNTFKNIIIFLYVVLCIIVSYYIRIIIFNNYSTFLLDYKYSQRNQLICGNNPIEKDTLRYTMSKHLKEEKLGMNSVLYLIYFVIFVSFVYILIYLFGSHKIPFLASFDNVQLYVANIFIIIIMVCIIGFQNNYVAMQRNLTTELYNTNMNKILDSTLLPPPPKISTSLLSDGTKNSIFNKTIIDTNNTDKSIVVYNTQLEGLYTSLVSRIMYTENLNSFQDAVNMWNGFTKNADIYPYLILTNNTTNNITPDTVIAKDYLNIWIKELSNNSVLKDSKAPITNSIIYNLDITTNTSVSSPTVLSNILVIKYIDIDKCQMDDYTQMSVTLKEPCTSNIVSIPTSFTKNIVGYINSNILPFLNSKTNIINSVNRIPSTINGITTQFQVLIGTQNVNNDYTILYNAANQIKNNSEIINSLYWLSDLSNGNPSVDIDYYMNINSKLFYIVIILICYLPYHFVFKKYSSFTVSLVVIFTCIIIPVLFIRLYFSYKILDAHNKQFNKKYHTTNAKISSILVNVFVIVIILSIILTIFYVIS